jgi:hypothetical protein
MLSVSISDAREYANSFSANGPRRLRGPHLTHLFLAWLVVLTDARFAPRAAFIPRLDLGDGIQFSMMHLDQIH